MKIRVLIADDHAILRSGLRLLINSEPDLEVIAEAADGAEAVARVKATTPDVVLLDLAMQRNPGLPAIPQILEASPRTRVLVLTMLADPASLRAALAAGASGFVAKTAADRELLNGIRSVAQGRSFVQLSADLEAVHDSTRPFKAKKHGGAGLDLLSPRERFVFALVGQGYTNQQIADQLGLSIKSVETYRARVMDKLGLRNRADLVRYAVDAGLLTPKRSDSD